MPSKNQKIPDFDCAACLEEVLFEKFNTSFQGLTQKEARERLEEYGYNELANKKKRTILSEIISKFLNPLVIVLLIIAGFSIFFGEKASAILVLVMAIMSVMLSFFQEHRAGKEAEKLSEMVRPTASVYRNGKLKELPMREIVRGDVVDLSAGDIIPADLRIISCKDLFLNQSSLTGESFPVEKTADPVKESGSLSDMTNIAFMGTSVESGAGSGVAVRTGLTTQFGEISRRLARMSVDTSFDKGIRAFTWLMIRAMLVLVVVIFAVNAVSKGDIPQALFFALAVAVGLTPEMLPMLVAINLSKGAIAMSKKKVIVKRLNSIQNFGAMDVLCTDKTGTLTLDKIVLEHHCDIVRREDEDVLRFAYINSYHQTGLKNIPGKAVLRYEKLSVKEYKKIDDNLRVNKLRIRLRNFRRSIVRFPRFRVGVSYGMVSGVSLHADARHSYNSHGKNTFYREQAEPISGIHFDIHRDDRARDTVHASGKIFWFCVAAGDVFSCAYNNCRNVLIGRSIGEKMVHRQIRLRITTKNAS